jgi:hypothetical protein
MVAALAAAAIWGRAEARAGEFRVMPDRPDLTDSAETIPRGTAQIETGVTFLRDASGDRPVRRLAVSGLLRLGLAETFEARLGADVFVRERGDGSGTSGVGDTTLGAKWHVLDDQGWRPAVGLLPFVKLPTASRGKGLGSGRVDFGGILALGKDLPADWHVDLNFGLIGVSLSEAPGGLFLQKVATGSFSWAVTDRVAPFWEFFYVSRDSPTAQFSVGTNFGVVVWAHPRVAIDVAGGFRLAGASPDWVVTGGLTVLLGPLLGGGDGSEARRPPPGGGPPAGTPRGREREATLAGGTDGGTRRSTGPQ